jgi:integral membrane protein TerC family protein
VFSAVPPLVWALTALGFLAVVVLDLAVIARRSAAVSIRQATLWVVVYVALAAAFAVGLFVFRGGSTGGEFVAGYITEYSLSVDNLFVFVIIMARFRVPAIAQDKVLYIGIVVSMLLRAVFIAAGAAAIAAASWVSTSSVPSSSTPRSGWRWRPTRRTTSTRRTPWCAACVGCCPSHRTTPARR